MTAQRLRSTTILAYLIGLRQAILAVAGNRAALWTAICLVIMAGVARNYDQTWIGENPLRWFAGPLLFSTLTGTLLFWFLELGFLRRHRTNKGHAWWRQWPAFMTCYWMTAPLAWFYAIPVEKFQSSLVAAEMNIGLLALVALWRVLLLSRAVSVVVNAPFMRVFPVIILFAAFEMVGITFFGGFFERAIMRGMGGLQNSPEEFFVDQAVDGFFATAFWMIPTVAFFMAVRAFTDESSRASFDFNPFPRQEPGRAPWLVIIICAFGWSVAAISQNAALKNSATLSQYFKEQNYRSALDLLAEKKLESFAWSRPIPPSIYGRGSLEELIGIIGHLQDSDPEWLQDFYLGRLRRTMELEANSMFWRQLGKLRGEQVKSIRSSVEKFEKGRRWLSLNEPLLKRLTPTDE